MTYQEENNKLVENFLKHTFGKGWKNPKLPETENFKSLEIFLNDKCNLACKYCYLQRFGDSLYPKDMQDPAKLVANMEMLLDWLDENDYVPGTIELFSGEVFIQEVAWKVMEMLIDRYKGRERKPEYIIVPTNFTFILSSDITARVDDLLARSREAGVPIGLSASFDGKYCEANRPFKSGKEIRDDDYYDRTFEFTKKWNVGFHPMVYSEHIHDWKQNWQWFQSNFTKHRLPWKNIYLLEVRNAEWTNDQIRGFQDFIRYLIDWSLEGPCGGDKEKYIDFLFNGGYNMLRNPFMTIGRGIGCSIQSNMTVRLGDLTWVPCHRTSYDPFNFGQFKTENGKITKFEARNVDMFTAMYSFDAMTQPWCEQCPMKAMCSFGCLGSQLEVLGDPFTPIPSVCQLEHAKVGAMLQRYKELGMLDMVLSKVGDFKANAARNLANIMNL